MFNSFSSALSSLRAHSAAVDTVGHNLANVNTTGFKAAGLAFKDIVAASLGARTEIGMGVTRPITVRNFSQGALQSTSGPLDAAIQDNGFFVTKDGAGASLLTRDGGFQLDRSGYVVTLTGERVQQYNNGKLEDIQIPTGASPARATSAVSITANVNATSATGTSWSTPVEVVDSLGVSHVLTFKFSKTGDGAWDIDVTVPPEDVKKPATDPPVSVITGSTKAITFDSNGMLATPAPPDNDPATNDADSGTIEVSVKGLASGGADMTIKWSLYDAQKAGLVTQFAQSSAASASTQDGHASAEIVSVGMADGGRVVAQYANGEQNTVATLAMALVANPESLTAVGNNNYRVSADSASPSYGLAGTGGRGKIKAGNLEASTVDIAREFTNLIVYQRGYQANSRVITTADEISQETLNLKR